MMIECLNEYINLELRGLVWIKPQCSISVIRTMALVLMGSHCASTVDHT